MNHFATDSSTSRSPSEPARTLRSSALDGCLAVALTLALGLAWPSARAEVTAKTVRPVQAKPHAKALVKAKPASAKVAPVELPPEAASEEQAI